MHKKTVTIFYVIGLALWIFGGLLLNSHPQQNAVLTAGEMAMTMVGTILFFVAWVGALVNSAKAGRWGWFFCLFFLSIFALIVYFFVGPGPTPKSGESSPASN
jgi:hypothetical protein